MKLTPTEVIDTLTGWEEIAIEQTTGKTLEQYQDEKHPNQVGMLRCLGAVLKWRDALAGDPDAKFPAAYREAMGLTQTQLGELFSDESEDDDVMPDEPDSEVGKDVSSLSGEQNAKPDSVSSPELLPTSTTT